MVYQDREQEADDAMGEPAKRRRAPGREMDDVRGKMNEPERPAEEMSEPSGLPGGLHDDKTRPEPGEVGQTPGQGVGQQDTQTGDVTAAGGPHPQEAERGRDTPPTSLPVAADRGQEPSRGPVAAP